MKDVLYLPDSDTGDISSRIQITIKINHWKSTKGTDHAVRYHSLHHNTYIRHFPGHTGLVTSLDMSPVGDQFLSCSTGIDTNKVMTTYF